MGKDTCELYCYDEAKVNRVRGSLERQNIEGMAGLFKMIADETRLKVVYALCQEEELCVCDVANVTGASLATASHHLRALNKQGLVSFRKEGKLAFYTLSDDRVRRLLETVAGAAREGMTVGS
ncbi:MAG TPA: metalloregulator ArsR/SmtB family transcription factor [Paenibacillus sp.]|nr:metalloregulator ArsR/SmtB family transcription factor [Paenibacillus sp.]